MPLCSRNFWNGVARAGCVNISTNRLRFVVRADGFGTSPVWPASRRLGSQIERRRAFAQLIRIRRNNIFSQAAG
jgi:hypothetical protein